MADAEKNTNDNKLFGIDDKSMNTLIPMDDVRKLLIPVAGALDSLALKINIEKFIIPNASMSAFLNSNSMDYKIIHESLINPYKGIGDILNKQSDQIKKAINVSNINSKLFLDYVESLKIFTDSHLSMFTKSNTYFKNHRDKFGPDFEVIVEVFEKYKWPIPLCSEFSLMHDIIDIEKEEKTSEEDKLEKIEGLLIEYHSKDNWANLGVNINNLEKSHFSEGRSNIIRDCFQVLQNIDDSTVAINAVLPTLIAQIDGFMIDFIAAKDILKLKGSEGQKEKFKCSILEPNNFDDQVLDILLEALFKGNKGKKLFDYNRHAILHGQDVSYGRKDSIIKTFIIIGFLASLK